MSKLWRVLPILLLVLAFAATPPVVQAQPNRTVVSRQASDEKLAQGELLKVDTEAMTLTIKNTEGSDIQFQYNSDTKVEGTTNGIQGLSTKTGTRVVIHYKEQSDRKLATRIEIAK